MAESIRPLDQEAIDRWLKTLVLTTRENAVILLTLDGVVLAWLGAAPLLFGYDAAQAVGMPLTRVFNDEDVAAGLEAQERALAIAAGRSEDDRWHKRRDGSLFWGSGVMEGVRDDSGQIVVLAKLVRDRTDVRSMTVALQNRLAAAEADRRARLDRLAALAHELRNQVSPIANLLSAVEKAAAPAALTGPMRRQLQGLVRLLDDLAAESVAAAGAGRTHKKRVEVQPLVRDAAQAMATEIERRGQTLKVTLPDAPIEFEVDPDRVDQVLINLLSNASKYTPAGGAIHLSATVEDDTVAIRVEDDGHGISGDVLPRIFELFTREPRPHDPGGFGIGLSVVKDIVERHGGFVEGRSPGVGQGSVFTVRLPIEQRPAPPPA